MLLSRLSIGFKLLISPMLLVVLLLAVAGAAMHGIGLQQITLRDIQTQNFVRYKQSLQASRTAQEAIVGAYAIVARITEAGITAPSEEIDLYIDDLRLCLDELQASIKALLTVQGADEEAQQQYAELSEQLGIFVKEVSELARAAHADPAGSVRYLGTVRPEYDRLYIQLSTVLDREAVQVDQALVAADQSASSLKRVLFGASLLALVLASVGGGVLRGHILGAIKRIEDAAIRLRDGDLTQRVAVVGRDEIARTAKAFNQLIDSFQQAITGMAKVAGSLDGSAEELVEVSTRAATGAQTQVSAAHGAAGTVDQLVVTTGSIASSAEAVRVAASESLQSAQAGQQSVQRLVDEVDEMAKAFAEITASVNEFVQRTAVITATTAQVRGLSEQTNLLALNAAIEAARAGASGRSFSVVADEVRSLAERSTRAANAIDEAATGLEDQSAKVGRALASGQRAMDGSRGLIKALEQELVSAGSQVAISHKGIDGITDAVVAQSSDTHDLARSVRHFTTLAATSHDVANQVEGSVTRLRGFVVELNQSAARFKV